VVKRVGFCKAKGGGVVVLLSLRLAVRGTSLVRGRPVFGQSTEISLKKTLKCLAVTGFVASHWM